MSDPKTYTEEEFLDLQTKSEETKTKLDEFRSNNVKLLKDMDALNAKFDGIDLDNYNEMIKLQQEQKDKTLIDAGKIDELLEERTKAMVKTHGDDMDKLTNENTVLNSQLAGLVIDSAVRDSAVKSGVVDTAIDDILLRSKAVFKFQAPLTSNRSLTVGLRLIVIFLTKSISSNKVLLPIFNFTTSTPLCNSKPL